MSSDLLPAAGHWVGSNGFRLMPGDPLADHPATATVTSAAGGNMTSFAYTWSHPDDGMQDGLLVFGLGGDDGSLVGLWGDSWHQHPALMSMLGQRTAPGVVELAGEYGGGWRWQIVIDMSAAGALTMRMDNVVPAAEATTEMPAGAYPAMMMQLLPADGIGPAGL